MAPVRRPSFTPMEDVIASRVFSVTAMVLFVMSVPAAAVYGLALSYWAYPLLLAAGAIPLFGTFMIVCSYLQARYAGPVEVEKYIELSTKQGERSFAGGSRRVPMEEIVELYINGHIDFRGDLLNVLRHRRAFASFVFNLQNLKFFVTQWMPETLTHSKRQDKDQVVEHYDRGNDFYNAFLGESMIYTSGLVEDEAKDTLEDMQHRKCDVVCHKIQLKRGERMLDIGCGWGTLAIHAAKHFGGDATGVTLAQNQVRFGTDRAGRVGVSDRVHLKRMDYRDIPDQKWDKITCLEMAEHVGVKNFQKFLVQVRDMMNDDGLFFLQIAGLRRPWQYEDLIWGLFMAKYVFPGADASMPLGWVTNQLELAGFEIQSIDNVGIHYSKTIKYWYENWVRNRDKVVASYGERWYRIWAMFLAWSTIVSEQGSATCFQILLNKNLNKVDRSRFFSGIFRRRVTVPA